MRLLGNFCRSVCKIHEKSRRIIPCCWLDLCVCGNVPADCRFVYVLVSATDPQRHYVGLASDVQRRLAVHNSGGSQHTAQHRPWRLLVALEFSSPASAIAFEKYLKSGSGRAFAKRHFV